MVRFHLLRAPRCRPLHFFLSSSFFDSMCDHAAIAKKGMRRRSQCMRLRPSQRRSAPNAGHKSNQQLLLRNVERGSQTMAKLRVTRGHSHPASAARSSKGTPDERGAFNSGVFETHARKSAAPNIASRSTSAHCRCYALKCSIWLVIRSGRQKYPIQKNL